MADSLNSACGLLAAFFGAREIDGIVASQRSFGLHLLPDIQAAALGMLSRLNVVRTGLHQPELREPLTISSLLVRCAARPVAIAPPEFHDFDLGDAESFRALSNALWLFRISNRPAAVLLSRSSSAQEGRVVRLEVATLPDARSIGFARDFLSSIQDAAAGSTRYRGKVVMLDPPSEAGMRVRRSKSVTRAQVILDDPTMARLDHHVFAFDRHRGDLRRFGQSTCRGLLLYGPPGNGKTHVTRYVSSNLPDRTTVLVTPDGGRCVAEQLQLARSFQPSLVVLENVDRFARDRQASKGSTETGGLQSLLSEMEGLEADADILFLFTATHPRNIDPALISQPGRIDVAIEIACPDASCRARLVTLYGASLIFDPGALPEIVARTEGASAAYLKEMVYRLALAALTTEMGNRITRRSVAVVLGEAIDSQARLDRGVVELADVPARRPDLRMAASGGRSADL
ncbi:hypothetical protein ASF58_17510 [Methylobacterium sp. Leaf125]|uniref:AAA family ATPase n=1 Tax=Methylobacterium sp. Leaf125 TaxID=1736265 RepID=UPI0006FC085A|nr:ATP-binding protein [Methylobacterium sp. Leaf125]KQQ46197.1 hypothetical protein ASF58_17510 [Methylobacterium sp. Leaf125]